MLNNLTKEQQLIILGLVLVIVAGLGVMAYRRMAPSGDDEISIEGPADNTQITKRPEVIVHVSGAVGREGVYRLRSGDRKIDAIKLAGGATALANLSSINLAEKMKDGEKIIVPEKPKVVARVSGEPVNRGSGTVQVGKVNINTAGEKALCKVKGIGKTTAKRIVEYRISNGPFSKIEDIMKVKSIGKSKFGKIKNQIII
jgi:competence protein ComEA